MGSFTSTKLASDCSLTAIGSVGPHLLAGLGMTGLIAVAASLSPYMQKGQNWARYTHIVLNLALLGLFGWQAVTGMDIVQRIISKM